MYTKNNHIVLKNDIIDGIMFFLVFLVGSVSLLQGAEDWRQYIKGLSDKGHYDIVLDYLQTASEKSNCPVDLKEELDYQKGVALMEQLKTLTVMERRSVLGTIHKSFQNFIENHPEHDKILEAKANLSQIIIYESKYIIAVAKAGPIGDEDRRQARQSLDQADKLIQDALGLARQRVEKLENKSDKQSTSDLEMAKGLYLNLRIQQAALPADRAETYLKNSEDAKKELKLAQTQLKEVCEKYKQYTGSYNAQYRQALIALQLEDYEEAQKITLELSSLPLEPAFYSILMETLLLKYKIFWGMEQTISEQEQCKTLLKLVQQFYNWKSNGSLPSQMQTTSTGQELHIMVVRAIIRLEEIGNKDRAEYIKVTKDVFGITETPFIKIVRNSNRMISYSRQMLEFVRNEAGSLAGSAEELLKSSFFDSIRKELEESSGNWNGLLVKARQSWQTYIRAYQDLQDASPGQSKIDAQKQFELQQDNVDHNLSAFLALAKKEKELKEDQQKEYNELRMNRTTLYFMRKEYKEAVIQAAEIIREKENSEGPRAAELALVSLRQMLASARDDGDDEKIKAIEQQIQKLIGIIKLRWDNEKTENQPSVVQEAFLVQIDMAINRGDLKEAQTILDQIPQDSSRRATAELRFGRSLWSSYLRLAAEENTEKKNQEQLTILLENARQTLSDGLVRILAASNVQQDEMNTVYSAFTLAQIYLVKNDASNAIKWLTHPVIGPYNLVSTVIEKKKTEEVTSSAEIDSSERSFQLATLILMLRVQVRLGNLEEAEKVSSQIEIFAKNEEKGTEQLTAIYIQLGKQLEEQLRQLSVESNNPDKQKEIVQVSQGFERFLEKISQRQNGNTWSSLRWVADTYMSLGRGISGSLTDAPPEAIAYYTKAGRTWQSVLYRIKAEPEWANNPKAFSIASVRLAECLRCTGRYDKAMEILLPALKEAPNSLDLQMEGARICQAQGRNDKNAYLQAILGCQSQDNGKNLVWGWNTIIMRLSRNMEKDPRLKDTFYDAYLNKFACRYLYTRRLTDANEIKKQAAEAERELLRLKQLHPELGGPLFRKKFEDHLKRLQKQQNEKG